MIRIRYAKCGTRICLCLLVCSCLKIFKTTHCAQPSIHQLEELAMYRIDMITCPHLIHLQHFTQNRQPHSFKSNDVATLPCLPSLHGFLHANAGGQLTFQSRVVTKLFKQIRDLHPTSAPRVSRVSCYRCGCFPCFIRLLIHYTPFLVKEPVNLLSKPLDRIADLVDVHV